MSQAISKRRRLTRNGRDFPSKGDEVVNAYAKRRAASISLHQREGLPAAFDLAQRRQQINRYVLQVALQTNRMQAELI